MADRRSGGGLLPTGLALALALGIATGAAAQSSPASAALDFPAPGQPRVTSTGNFGEGSGLRGLWFSWESQLAEGDVEGAKKTAEEIRKQAKRLGVIRLTEMSLAASAAGHRAARAEKAAAAEEAFSRAVEFDPTLPDAEFAWADHLRRTNQFVPMLKHYGLGAAKIFQNVIPRRSIENSGAVILTLAAFAAALIVWMSLVLRHVGAFLHDVHEILDEKLGPFAAGAVGVAVLFAPLFLTFGPPYAISFSLLVLWGYAKPFERATATLTQLILALVPAALLFVAEQGVAIRGPIFVGAVDLAEHRYDPAIIDRLEELSASSPTNAELWYLLGSLYRDAGRNERAIAYFRKALELDKTLAEAAVNLGSVYYLDGDISASIRETRRALEIDPKLAIAHYNLSVAYNEMSNFEDGSKSLSEAKSLDENAVSRWVRDNRIQNADLPVARAKDKSLALEGDLSGKRRSHLANPTTILLFLLAILAPVAHLVRRSRLGYAGACVKCGRTYCRRCKAATESGIYCSQCVHIFLKKDGVAIDTKMSKVREVQQYLQREELRRRWSSVVLPGVAQVVSGQPFRGLLLGFGFFVCLFGALLAGRLYRPVVLPTGFFDALSVILALLALLFWVLANFRILRPIRVETN